MTASALRNFWPMGRVQEVYKDKKELVCSVKVKTKTAVVVRPVNKLYMLLEQKISTLLDEYTGKFQFFEHLGSWCADDI